MALGLTTRASGFLTRFFLLAGMIAVLILAACGRDEPAKSRVARPRLQVCDYQITVFFGAGGDSERIRLLGWAPTEGGFTWTDGIGSSLGLRLPHSEYPVRMNLKAAGMNVPGIVPFQPVEVLVNGEKIASWEVADEKVHSAIIPQRFVEAPESFLFIDFYLPKATSPLQVGQAPDGRRLGLRVVDLRFEKAPEAAGQGPARP